MDIPVAVAGWSNQAETFLTLIDTYKTKEMFCDCTLACKEKFFRAHKMILSMCSELFEKIFLTTQDKNPVIILHEIEAWQIECLLNYMYKGETCVSDSKFPSLCKVATYLQIKGFDKLEMYRQAVKAAQHKGRLISSKMSSKETSWSTSYPSKYGSKSSPDYNKDTQRETSTVLMDNVKEFSNPSPQESISRDGSYYSSQPSSVSDEVLHQNLELTQSMHRMDSERHHKIKPENEPYQTTQTLTSNVDMNHNSEFLSSPRLHYQSKHGSERNSPISPEFKDAKLYWQSKYQNEMNIHRPAAEQMRDEDYNKKYVQCSKYRDIACPQMFRKRLENHRLIEEDHRTITEEPWNKEQTMQLNCKPSIANSYRDPVRRVSPSQMAVAQLVSSPTVKMRNQNQVVETVYIKTEIEDQRLDEHSNLSEPLDSPLRTPEKAYHYSPSYLNNYSHAEGSSPNQSEDIRGTTHLKHKLTNTGSEPNLSHDFSSNEVTKKHKAAGILRALPPLLKIVSSCPSSPTESFSLKHDTTNETEEGKFRLSDPLLEKIPTNKRKRVRGPKSWEFLLRLLRSPSGNPSLIKWEDEEEGIFRLIKPEVIAQRWGQRTGKHDHDVLSYESFSRGLRYHYATGALCAVSEKSFVYQFGPKAQKALKNVAHSPHNVLKQE